MAYCTVLSAAIEGLHVEEVHVEADISNGLPVFHMVGYLSCEVKEASERVKTAIHNSGYQLPAKRIVVNLAPATVRKTGASFDLPIALAILAALGEFPAESLDRTMVIGELGLDGRVREVSGVLPVVLEAKHMGCTVCILPRGNVLEGALVTGVRIIGVESLRQACQCLSGQGADAAGQSAIMSDQNADMAVRSASVPGQCTDMSDQLLTMSGQQKRQAAGEAGQPVIMSGQGETAVSHADRQLYANKTETVDFGDIRGQGAVRRAAEVAVAGGHNLLLIGPPGSGKSMIARRIPTILPPPTQEESMEMTKIYSVMGMLDRERPLLTGRPFRSVHHTVTKASLIGGGTVPVPGEVTLAHGGVLFLDELAEFQKPVLEVLRQPLEEGVIRINRVRGNYVFPSDFILVAAMNPCPCGNFPDFTRCTCTRWQVQNYLSHVSQPFLDRIDICAEAPRISYTELSGGEVQETSAEIRERVVRARRLQSERFSGTQIRTNSMIGARQIGEYCRLGQEEEALMRRAFSALNLTARTYHRILRVARTIADLDSSEQIRAAHLREAIGYRSMDKKYWGR